MDRKRSEEKESEGWVSGHAWSDLEAARGAQPRNSEPARHLNLGHAAENRPDLLY
jgi:hypothetical protein